MSTVADLTPGDVVEQPDGATATFIVRTRHPLYPHLELVVWRLADGGWSHDALHLMQHDKDVLFRGLDLRPQSLGDPGQGFA